MGPTAGLDGCGKFRTTEIRSPDLPPLSTTGIIPSLSKESTRQFETAQSSPCSIYPHAESNSTEYMPCSSGVLSRIMYKQCLVSGPHYLKSPKPPLIQNIIIIICNISYPKCLWLLRKMQPRLLNLSLLGYDVYFTNFLFVQYPSVTSHTIGGKPE